MSGPVPCQAAACDRLADTRRYFHGPKGGRPRAVALCTAHARAVDNRVGYSPAVLLNKKGASLIAALDPRTGATKPYPPQPERAAGAGDDDPV